MNKGYLIPPIFPAAIITINQFIHMMSRPDTISIPFITEIPVFVISYILFAIVNRIAVVPLTKILISRTSNRKSSFIFSLCIAVSGSYILFWADIFNKSTIFHRAYFFGAFLPLLVMALCSFHYLKTHINHDRHREDESGT